MTAEARKVQVVSFGYLHAPPPEAAHLTLDVREYLRDPAAVAGLLDLDGLDERVARAVAATPGAGDTIATLVGFAASFPRARCVLAIGCAGGRHRSVAIAEAVAAELARLGVSTEVRHRDMHHPRVIRTAPELRSRNGESRL